MKTTPRTLVATLITLAVLAPLALFAPQALAARVDTSSPKAFIRSVAPMAQASQKQYGVPASVAIAQAILESGWGKSGLTQKGNAFFGIKCSAKSTYASGCMNVKTREVYSGKEVYIVDGFRTYPKPENSFLDHGLFLRSNARYAKAFQYLKEPKKFIREVHRAGYATDPNYTTLIVSIMDSNNLYQYDKVATTPAKATTKPASPKATTKQASPKATARPTGPAAATPTAKATATPPVKTTATPTAKATATATATATPTAKTTVTPPAKTTVTPTAKTTAAPTVKTTATPQHTTTPAPTRIAEPTTTPQATATSEPAEDDTTVVGPTQPQDPDKAFPSDGGMPNGTPDTTTPGQPAATPRAGTAPAGDPASTGHAAPGGEGASTGGAASSTPVPDAKDATGGLAKTGA